MAQSTGAIASRTGIALAALLLAGGLGAIASLFFTGLDGGGGGATLSISRIAAIIRSAGIQAGLSAAVSAGIALLIAPALHRMRHHRARIYHMARLFCGVAFIIPTTVAAAGLLEIWGRAGFIADTCRIIASALAGDGAASACGGFSIYGLHGVVLGHVFLNLPLMILVFLPLLEAIPPRQYAIARHLGMARGARWRLIEWPAMRPALPAAAILVFLLCFSSFAPVLMLGGGPRVTTPEVEIYAAIRFDFDFRGGAILALVQCACAAMLVALMARAGGGGLRGGAAALNPLDAGDGGESAGGGAGAMRFADSRLWDLMCLAVFILLVILPLGAVIISGLGSSIADVISQSVFAKAFRTSLLIALATAVLVMPAGLLLAHARMRSKGRMQRLILDGGVMLYLVIPSIVLGTAAFLVLGARGDAFAYAFPVVVLANMLLALPFAVRIFEGGMRRLYPRHDRLAESLGIIGATRWRLLTLPALAREAGLVTGLAAAMSFGDLGVIALFAGSEIQTLPWMLYQLAGKYRGDEAAALALILLLLAFALLLACRATASRIAASVSRAQKLSKQSGRNRHA